MERDVLSILDRLHVLLPVGFYYKTFIRPRWMWAVADRVIRRTVGLGRLPAGPAGASTSRHLHCDVLVVGGGESGRAAAVSAADRGEHAVLCDEGEVADPPEGVDVLARHAAIGAYEGPMVSLASADGLVQVHPQRVVVATGGTEVHPVFPGNDLPGVMLGRAAAGLADDEASSRAAGRWSRSVTTKGSSTWRRSGRAACTSRRWSRPDRSRTASRTASGRSWGRRCCGPRGRSASGSRCSAMPRA